MIHEVTRNDTNSSYIRFVRFSVTSWLMPFGIDETGSKDAEANRRRASSRALAHQLPPRLVLKLGRSVAGG